MPKIKQPLENRLEAMSEDIQIGGDLNFRAMGIAVVLGGKTTLTQDDRAEMERLLKRAQRLLDDLSDFWIDRPALRKISMRDDIAAHDTRPSTLK